MRVMITMLMAASTMLLATGTASAAGSHEINDSTYIAIAKCAGLAEATGADVSPFTDMLKAQTGVRTSDVLDRADEARRDAKREADHAGEDGKARYVRQVDGACHNYLQHG